MTTITHKESAIHIEVEALHGQVMDLGKDRFETRGVWQLKKKVDPIELRNQRIGNCRFAARCNDLNVYGFGGSRGVALASLTVRCHPSRFRLHRSRRPESQEKLTLSGESGQAQAGLGFA